MPSSTVITATTQGNRTRSSPPSYRSGTIWCEGCKTQMGNDAAEMNIHRKSESHIDNCILKGLYCPTCDKVFANNAEKRAHNNSKKHRPEPISNDSRSQNDAPRQQPRPAATDGVNLYPMGPTATTPVWTPAGVVSPSDSFRSQCNEFSQSVQPFVVDDALSYPTGPAVAPPVWAPAAAGSPSVNTRGREDTDQQSFLSVVVEDDVISYRMAYTATAPARASPAAASPPGNFRSPEAYRQSFQPVVTEDDAISSSTVPTATAPAPAPACVASPSNYRSRQLWCDACKIFVDSGSSLIEHWKLETHSENCKREGLYCEPCNKVFFSNREHLQHNEGKKHKLVVERRTAPILGTTTELTPNNLQSQNDASPQLPRPAAVEDHATSSSVGSAAAASIQATAAPLPSKPPRQIWCGGCKTWVTTGPSGRDHRELDSHIENCKRKGFYCESCDKVFFSIVDLKGHNEGRRHKQKVNNETVHMPGITTDLMPDNPRGQDTAFQSFQPVATEDYAASSSPGPTVAIPVQPAVVPFSSNRQLWCDGCRIMVDKGRPKKDHRKLDSHIENCKREGLYCDSCDKIFFSKTDHIGHYESKKHAKSSLPRWCNPCEAWILRGAVFKSHQQSISHIDNCKRKGLYCHLCDKTFLSPGAIQWHPRRAHNIAFASNEPIPVPTVTNDHASSAFASQNDAYSPSVSSQPDDSSEALRCDICLALRVPGESAAAHQNSQEHIDAYKALGLNCSECRNAFEVGTRPRPHQCDPDPPVISEPDDFHCETCGQVFPTRRQMEKHPEKCGLTEPTDESTFRTPTPKPAAPTPSPGFRCEACQIWVESPPDTHLRSEVHIDKCKLMGLHYCIPCKKPFFTKASLSNHELNIHPLVFCKICNINYPLETSHGISESHITACKEKGLYCEECKKTFYTDGDMKTHIRTQHNSSRPSGFHCVNCNKSFPSNSQFLRHIRGGCVLTEVKSYACDPCGLSFQSHRELNQHFASNNHKTIKCPGGDACDRRFKTLPAMIMHLESGACVSKLNRASIDALVRSRDIAGAVTIKGIPAPAAAGQLTGVFDAQYSTINSVQQALTEKMDADTDVKDEFDDILTPGLTLNSTPTPLSTAPTSIGCFNPTAKEFEPQLPFIQSCPICGQKFSSKGLQMHVASPVHATPAYHCPNDFLASIGLSEKDNHTEERVFKSLSSLMQHIEAGACKGGKESWEKTMKFLEAALEGFGISGVKLLGQ